MYVLRAVRWMNVLKKVARKRFIFGPSSINHFPCKLNFILYLSQKNLHIRAHREADYFPRGCTEILPIMQIDRIAVDLRSPLVDRTRTRPGCRTQLKIDTYTRL